MSILQHTSKQKASLLLLGLPLLSSTAFSQARQDLLNLRNRDFGNEVIADGRGGIAATGEAVRSGGVWSSDQSGLWVAATSPGSAPFTVVVPLGSGVDSAGQSLVATDELDGFIVVGWQDAGTGREAVVLRVDSTGSTVWSRVLDFGPEDSEAHHVVAATGGRYAVVGRYGSDLLAFIVDGAGVVTAEAAVGGPGDESGARIRREPTSGNFVAVGRSIDALGNQASLFAVTFDPALGYLASNEIKVADSTYLEGVDVDPRAGGLNAILASDSTNSSAHLILATGIVPSIGATHMRAPVQGFKPGGMTALPSGELRICGASGIRAAMLRTTGTGTVLSGRQYFEDGTLNSIVPHPNGTNLIALGTISTGPNLSDAYFVTAGMFGGSCASRGYVTATEVSTTEFRAYGTPTLLSATSSGSLTLVPRGSFMNLCQ